MVLQIIFQKKDQAVSDEMAISTQNDVLVARLKECTSKQGVQKVLDQFKGRFETVSQVAPDRVVDISRHTRRQVNSMLKAFGSRVN